MSFNRFFNDPFFTNDPFANDPFFNPMATQNRNANNRLTNNGASGTGGGTGGDQSRAISNDPFNPGNQMASIFGGGAFGGGFGGGPGSLMTNMMGNMGMEDHFFGNSAGSGFGGGSNQIHVTTKDNHYELTLEIYNLDKSSVDLHIDPVSKMVSVSGSVVNETNQNGFQSFSSQSFSQSVSLPSPQNEEIDDTNVQITYADNILTILVPKQTFQALQDDPGNYKHTNDRYIENRESSPESNKIEEL